MYEVWGEEARTVFDLWIPLTDKIEVLNLARQCKVQMHLWGSQDLPQCDINLLFKPACSVLSSTKCFLGWTHQSLCKQSLHGQLKVYILQKGPEPTERIWGRDKPKLQVHVPKPSPVLTEHAGCWYGSGASYANPITEPWAGRERIRQWQTWEGKQEIWGCIGLCPLPLKLLTNHHRWSENKGQKEIPLQWGKTWDKISFCC